MVLKHGEIPTFRTSLAKNSILDYISWKIANLGKVDDSTIMTFFLVCMKRADPKLYNNHVNSKQEVTGRLI